MKKEDISIDNKIDQMRRSNAISPLELSIDQAKREKTKETKVIKRLEMRKAASWLGVSSKALLKMLRKHGYFIKCVNDNLPKPELIEKAILKMR